MTVSALNVPYLALSKTLQTIHYILFPIPSSLLIFTDPNVWIIFAAERAQLKPHHAYGEISRIRSESKMISVFAFNHFLLSSSLL